MVLVEGRATGIGPQIINSWPFLRHFWDIYIALSGFNSFLHTSSPSPSSFPQIDPISSSLPLGVQVSHNQSLSYSFCTLNQGSRVAIMLSNTLVLVGGLLAGASSFQTAVAQNFPPGVIATGTMGVNNPPQATLGTAINQTSMARLITANSVDVRLHHPARCPVMLSRKLILQDFCLFAPPTVQDIANSEVGHSF